MIRSSHRHPLLPLLLGGLVLLTAGCRPSADEPASDSPVPLPPLNTAGDSLAMRIYEAHGGPDAWASVPYLRFDFGFGSGDEKQVRARHLWDRQSGDYRVEWTQGADSAYVVLFNVNSRDGQAYLNGDAVDTTRNKPLLEQAYRRFINDTYWLLMPLKLLDPGVQRTYVADSSTAEVEVVRLNFDEVGLTPGDRYWVYADRQTGLVERWAYVLQGNPDAPPRAFRWTGYVDLPAPDGALRLATRKEVIGGSGVIHTDALEVLTTLPPGLLSDPEPRL